MAERVAPVNRGFRSGVFCKGVGGSLWDRGRSGLESPDPPDGGRVMRRGPAPAGLGKACPWACARRMRRNQQKLFVPAAWPRPSPYYTKTSRASAGAVGAETRGGVAGLRLRANRPAVINPRDYPRCLAAGDINV
ncbi:hypothetical protein AAFF_G00352290 [Aldrovandia affinis]|uniref:Uncharacterized protein n=1 Tax=Aldrovandia affinis TaxID=143900 RepID=A0AAD7SIW1_9TELE|nr:hypothetical protein AAFF_G00352290 [Aldrovandia affinis]